MPPRDARSWHDLGKAIDQALDLAKQTAPIRQTAHKNPQLAQPFPADTAARKWFSISRLQSQLQLEEIAPAPLTTLWRDDEAGPTAGGADLGTLVHQTLACIPFGTEVDVRSHVNRWVEAAGSKFADLADSATQLVEQFLHSTRAKELAAAGQLHRELEFILAWPPRASHNCPHVTEVAPKGKPLEAPIPYADRFLQGFIDCLYQDSKGFWHVVDYKTNQVAAPALVQAAMQYEMQLGVYALAVEQILGQSPVELTLHFLRPSLEHRFTWDDSMRQRTLRWVNQSIAAVVLNAGS